MRRVPLALLLLLVFASAATGVQVHASTDCERWISEYKNELAQSDLAKRAAAASRRLHHYVHRKVVKLTAPNPRPKIRARVLPARLERPKMTREETLRELEFACGELPIEPADLKQEIAYSPRPVLDPRLAEGDDLASPFSLGQDGPQSLLASNDGPSNGGVPAFGGIPGIGGGGGGLPGRSSNNGGGGNSGGNNGGGGGNNGGGGTGGNTPPDGPPTAVAPEPGSLFLVATGIVGVAGAVRRRVRAA